MTPALPAADLPVADAAIAAAVPETAVAPVAGPRSEKELLVATRVFTEEDKAKGWWATGSSLAVLAAFTAGALFSPWWPLRVVFGILQGLTIVRVFCLFHDFQHGAILRQSKLAEAIYGVFGVTILVPPSVWRESHNYHHANNAKMVGSHIGSYPVVTLGMWKAMSPRQRFAYKMIRSPLNIFFAVFTVFTLGMCVSAFLRAPKKHWQALLSLVVVYGSAIVAGVFGRFDLWFFGWLIPMWWAAMEGAYLFYAQHNFPEGHIADRRDWTFVKAATDSSSYLVMGPVMNWFTANIGYHHVHHLNAAIPFYRLPEAMEKTPELQNPGTTTFAPKDIKACFELGVFDVEQNKMVGYPSA
ncbi:MAG: fatty acid desaturase family protein [Archangium sp.]